MQDNINVEKFLAFFFFLLEKYSISSIFFLTRALFFMSIYQSFVSVWPVHRFVYLVKKVSKIIIIKKAKFVRHNLAPNVGVSNGPIQFNSARKIWPSLELLAKIR